MSAIQLCNPKYAHNVGAAVRAASCFGIDFVWYSGDRVARSDPAIFAPSVAARNEYEAELLHSDNLVFGDNLVRVAVEIRADAQSLPEFQHPENALYVFGPEDGSVSEEWMAQCTHTVTIPSRHCVNLSAAVYIVLYDRTIKSGSPWNPVTVEGRSE